MPIECAGQFNAIQFKSKMPIDPANFLERKFFTPSSLASALLKYQPVPKGGSAGPIVRVQQATAQHTNVAVETPNLNSKLERWNGGWPPTKMSAPAGPSGENAKEMVFFAFFAAHLGMSRFAGPPSRRPKS